MEKPLSRKQAATPHLLAEGLHLLLLVRAAGNANRAQPAVLAQLPTRAGHLLRQLASGQQNEGQRALWLRIGIVPAFAQELQEYTTFNMF